MYRSVNPVEFCVLAVPADVRKHLLELHSDSSVSEHAQRRKHSVRVMYSGNSVSEQAQWEHSTVPMIYTMMRTDHNKLFTLAASEPNCSCLQCTGYVDAVSSLIGSDCTQFAHWSNININLHCLWLQMRPVCERDEDAQWQQRVEARDSFEHWLNISYILQLSTSHLSIYILAWIMYLSFSRSRILMHISSTMSCSHNNIN